MRRQESRLFQEKIQSPRSEAKSDGEREGFALDEEVFTR
jgi:hypothetical protein